MSDLSDALARLARYRQKLGDDQIIDEETGLSAHDLDTIITIAGASVLDPGIASEPTAADVADKLPHSEPITNGSDRPLVLDDDHR